MLEQIDLNKTIPEKEFNDEYKKLAVEAGKLQRRMSSYKRPVIIIMEGPESALKTVINNKFILCFDPRWFRFSATAEPESDEKRRPYLYRFWKRIPGEGKICIFDNSWYEQPVKSRAGKSKNLTQCRMTYDEINRLEKKLVDGRYIILKYFLHTGKKEQKKQLKSVMKTPYGEHLSGTMELQNENYSRYIKSFEEMLEETDTGCAPWHIIESEDWRYAVLKILNVFIQTLSTAFERDDFEKDTEPFDSDSPVTEIPLSSVLETIDMDRNIGDEEYDARLPKLQRELVELQYEMYMKKIPTVIVYEGWDASGKGGNIRRVTQSLDPRYYDVEPFAAPDRIERQHHYLWRFWKHIPGNGHIQIFDRSWYGRVLVERVEKLTPSEEWKRAYREINDMEKAWTDFGTNVIKFWLHIDKDEQLERFRAREESPEKKWKITEEDWRNREKWDEYFVAADEMLFRTSTSYAPWTVVESNCKKYARIKTLETIIASCRKKIEETE